jgi:hypothetical protein
MISNEKVTHYKVVHLIEIKQLWSELFLHPSSFGHIKKFEYQNMRTSNGILGP